MGAMTEEDGAVLRGAMRHVEAALEDGTLEGVAIVLVAEGGGSAAHAARNAKGCATLLGAIEVHKARVIALMEADRVRDMERMAREALFPKGDER